MKLVLACLSTREDRESSCEVGATPFMYGKQLITPFSPPRRYCEARLGLFKCQTRSRKLFSPLWKP